MSQATSQPQYRIYATLLDAYQWYLNSQADNAFQDLIDRINRVPFVSEAAEKGTAFNEVVDLALAGEPIEPIGDIIPHGPFAFDAAIVKTLVDNLQGAISQVRLSANMNTCHGLVELYGIIDEMLPALITVDIKTTGNYNFPKYLNNWQHRVYPFILRDKTGCDGSFTYLVTDFKEVYAESYEYDHTRDEQLLRGFVEQFIEFLNDYRHLITDEKIFGYIPKPVAI